MRAAVLAGIALLAALGGASAQDAQNFPSQAVRIIVNLSPGSVADGLARTVADKLSKT